VTDENPDGPPREAGPFELGTDGPKVILAGLDGTVTSMRAAAYAAGLARRQGARLVIVYVEQHSSMYGAAASGGGAAVFAEEEKALVEAAAELRQEAEEGAARLGVPLTFITTAGDPFHELRRVADEVRADAVVVGASTKAGHRLVGSLAVRLVRAGRWPVTVVP
jgi:nucleotide-binding universal stress UspA family protein